MRGWCSVCGLEDAGDSEQQRALASVNGIGLPLAKYEGFALRTLSMEAT